MADWIFQGNPRHYDLDASVASSREQWWGTPRYRDRMAVGDRVWLQVVGPNHPGIYYVATIVSQTYEHPVQPADPAHFRWRTDIRFDCRIRPPLLRSELLDDVQLGSFRPFRGFQGSNVPVPPDVAAALAARAAPRLEPLPPENGLGPSAQWLAPVMRISSWQPERFCDRHRHCQGRLRRADRVAGRVIHESSLTMMAAGGAQGDAGRAGPFRDPPMGGRRGSGLWFALGPGLRRNAGQPPGAGRLAGHVAPDITAPLRRRRPSATHQPPGVLHRHPGGGGLQPRAWVDICSLGQVDRLDGEGAGGCTP